MESLVEDGENVWVSGNICISQIIFVVIYVSHFINIFGNGLINLLVIRKVTKIKI